MFLSISLYSRHLWAGAYRAFDAPQPLKTMRYSLMHGYWAGDDEGYGRECR